ncbi:hypothetical protein LXL04_028649 [Taraxacum kok-saghyz]
MKSEHEIHEIKGSCQLLEFQSITKSEMEKMMMSHTRIYLRRCRTPAIASSFAIAPYFAVASCFAIASSGVEVSRLLPAVASCFGDLEERTEKEEQHTPGLLHAAPMDFSFGF